MKKNLTSFFLLLVLLPARPQSIQQQLAGAWKLLLKDPMLRHALISVDIRDAATHQRIFSAAEETGLAPASCQKIFTSVAVLDELGPAYRYQTRLGYSGSISEGKLNGDLIVQGSGDPSLGSWRWPETGRSFLLSRLVQSVIAAGIHEIGGHLLIDNSRFSLQPLPGGWIWEDIGNYYGAGSWGINWNENQYDLILGPGKKAGDSATFLGWDPQPGRVEWINGIKTAAAGTGDNGYIYLPPAGSLAWTDGTIPAGNDSFIISGSLPDPPRQFGSDFLLSLNQAHIPVYKPLLTAMDKWRGGGQWPSFSLPLLTLYSPALDSLNFWFLRKSINLYGEVFVKTLALEKNGWGSTEEGVALLQSFWVARGIDSAAIRFLDGSGLSPQNRVTTSALVAALAYARTRPWYGQFYQALPEINGMKMKSGSIGGVKSYAGYQKCRNHHEYIFAIIVNNFDGDGNVMVKKIWRFLDLLK